MIRQQKTSRTRDWLTVKQGLSVNQLNARGVEMSRLLIIAAGSGAVVAAVLTVIWTMQRRLIYFPIGDVPTPDEIGLSDVEPVTFETTDGLRLNAWFVAASGPLSRVTVLVFNGNAGNRAHRAPLAAAFQHHGLQVLLVDYRGYGGNPGTPTENGLAADSRAAHAYLAGRPDVPRAPSSPGPVRSDRSGSPNPRAAVGHRRRARSHRARREQSAPLRCRGG